MKDYKKLNILAGWGVFLIATITYLLTLEPTVSFWDCGEFISASYKLQVGHPPGAPLFLLIGRIFSLFAGNNPAKVAMMVNALSALVSSFTILFLFWTITHLVKRMFQKGNEMSRTEKLIILGSGLVGALAYTFSDTFWFSAVEGEVYATSSLFTAVVFWAILKWENEADGRFANRWLVLIAYLMGLSIGVHLLNLLAIPAIVLIYYFRKYSITPKGVFVALLVSGGIVGTVMYIIIPGLVKVAIQFELMFTNGFGMAFFSGVFVYLTLLIGAIVFGLYYTQKNGKVLANTIILIFGVICIGYSSYATIVIRSLANPPMDQNNPETMFNLLSYLNRDQYGDRPLIYGHTFNAPYELDDEGQPKIDEDKPVYVREDGKYKLVGYTQKPDYKDDFNILFPRMYSHTPDHIAAYKHWASLDDSKLYRPKLDRNGQVQLDQQGNQITEPAKKPGFIDNMTFLFRYQLGHMYYRYFMWNFAGRQNDIQARSRNEINSGNWLTGIKRVDAQRLGNQSELTSEMLNNKGRNTYFLLPLLLGIVGMLFHFRRDKKNFWVVMSLFFFTGIAIVLYLNQTPLQPRERDYAYAGSFYAFAIWIGMAVVGLYQTARETNWNDLLKLASWGGGILIFIALFDYSINDRLSFFWTYLVLLVMLMAILALFRSLGKVVKQNLHLSAGILAACITIPLLMAFRNWDDHDRSGRYTARDVAFNYLNSCGNQAILYTMGDNETFPVWYLQDVEEERTDIRTINLSYLNMDWYINQMRQKAYDSEPIKMTLRPEQLYFGLRDQVVFAPGINGYMDLKTAIDSVGNDDIQPKRFELRDAQGTKRLTDPYYYIPGSQFYIPLDDESQIANSVMSGAESVGSKRSFEWQMRGGQLSKSQLMMMDFMASNSWERPICYAATMGNIRNERTFLGIHNYLESYGMAYTVNPIDPVELNKDSTYNNLMNRFRWGGIDEGDIYLNEDCRRMYRHMRLTFYNLVMAYLSDRNQDPDEQDKEKAKQLLEKATALFPVSKVPYDWAVSGFIQAYGMLGETEKVVELSDQVRTILTERLAYINSLETPFNEYIDDYYVEQTIYALWDLFKITRQNGLTDYEINISESLTTYVTTNYSKENLTQARSILKRIVEEYTNNVNYFAATGDPSVLNEVIFYQEMKDHFISISRMNKDAEFIKSIRARLVKADIELSKAYEQTGMNDKAQAIKEGILGEIEKSYQGQDAKYALQLVHAIYANLAQGIVRFKEYPNMQLMEGLNANKRLLDSFTVYQLAQRDKYYNKEQMQEIMVFSWELIKFNYLSNDMEGGEKHERAFLNFIQECYLNQQFDMVEFSVNTIYSDLLSNEQEYLETSAGQIAGELYYDYIMLSKFASLFRSFGNEDFSNRLENELKRFEPLINSISNQ